MTSPVGGKPVEAPMSVPTEQLRASGPEVLPRRGESEVSGSVVPAVFDGVDPDFPGDIPLETIPGFKAAVPGGGDGQSGKPTVQTVDFGEPGKGGGGDGKTPPGGEAKGPDRTDLPAEPVGDGALQPGVDPARTAADDAKVLNGESPAGGEPTAEQVAAAKQRVRTQTELPQATLDAAEAGRDAQVPPNY